MTQVQFTSKFLDSLLKLPAIEIPKAIKAMSQIKKNPFHPSLQLHQVKQSKSNFHTARISRGARLVVHLDGDNILICHADTHDEAYKWAGKNKLKNDPSSGTARIIEIDEVHSRKNYEPHFHRQAEYIPTEEKKNEIDVSRLLFSAFSEKKLREIGLDDAALENVRQITNEEQLDPLEQILGTEIQTNLIALYLEDEIPYPHWKTLSAGPESQTDEGMPWIVEFTETADILSALKQPWEMWIIFLSGAQNRIVKANFNGPSKVFGGAGTGKTVVAIHRAKYLIQQSQNKKPHSVGLLTYSKVLAKDLKHKADMLLGSATKERKTLKITYLEQVALELLEKYQEKNFHILNDYTIHSKLTELSKKMELDTQFSYKFIISEYENVIGPWELWDYNDYKDFERKGRKTRLSKDQRQILSGLYSKFSEDCMTSGQITPYHLYHLANLILENHEAVFEHIIIDETQDLGPHMLKFVRSLVTKKPNDIMLCGDTGQSLYKRFHSFKRHGLEVVGKSKKLSINYRTSYEIKETADKVNSYLIDIDTGEQENRSSISIFNGPKPKIKLYENRNDEIDELIEWVELQISMQIKNHEIIILTESNTLLRLAEKSLKQSRISCWCLDNDANFLYNEVGLAKINRVKGLEYRSVAIIGCDEDQFPSEEKLKNIGDNADLDELLILEKNLLYVAITRARDNLLISGIKPGSSYLTELEF